MNRLEQTAALERKDAEKIGREVRKRGGWKKMQAEGFMKALELRMLPGEREKMREIINP